VLIGSGTVLKTTVLVAPFDRACRPERGSHPRQAVQNGRQTVAQAAARAVIDCGREPILKLRGKQRIGIAPRNALGERRRKIGGAMRATMPHLTM
jgi:hypothetical protein